MTSKIKVDNIADQDDNNIINESGDVITVGAAGDTVAVAGNVVKSNALQASDAGNIISQSGTTITIGASGDTVSLASGASQSGFGRSGSVDWQTGSIKTATFTATSGEGYFCNTTGGVFTVNLPSSPSGGAIVAIKDYAQTFATNNLTVGRGGSNIEGVAADITLDGNAESITLVYVDGTKGWVLVSESTTIYGQQFVTATGGTITTSGNFKIHTFTGPGTFCVSCAGNPAGSTTVDYMVVAGGGGSPESTPAPDYSYANGGAGAGGFRESCGGASGCYTASPLAKSCGALPVSVQGYPITVGGGGTAGAPGGSIGGNGANSVFSTITSAGGGRSGAGGGGVGTPANGAGADGGSGGGAGGNGPGAMRLGGSGNTPPVSPAQGKDGGDGTDAGATAGGGGGGATTCGADATGTGGNGQGGNGGAGATTNISGSPTAYAGGGGGGSTYVSTPAPEIPSSTVGSGGTGGGGAGTKNGTANAGTANTGGGAGGTGASNSPNNGATGGSGVVIIRYKFQ